MCEGFARGFAAAGCKIVALGGGDLGVGNVALFGVEGGDGVEGGEEGFGFGGWARVDEGPP